MLVCTKAINALTKVYVLFSGVITTTGKQFDREQQDVHQLEVSTCFIPYPSSVAEPKVPVSCGRLGKVTM